MHKIIETHNLNIPKDDIDCWGRYPKHRWVYDLSRLLDAQHIEWSPFFTNSLQHKEVNMDLNSYKDIEYTPAYIYINELIGDTVYSEVYIIKGEVKLIKHLDNQELIGDLELRINAFVSIYFQKFNGVITIKSVANTIRSVHLYPYTDMCTNSELMRLTKRIYKKIDISLNGLTDQVIRESIAS